MKFFRLTSLLAAALFAAVVVVPFLPLAKTASDLVALEVRMTATAAGRVQLYFDDGSGYSESATSSSAVARDVPTTHRLPLKPGRYRALRFDPLDHAGTVVIESLKLVDREGGVRRTFAFAEFATTQQVAARREIAARLELVVAPGTNDPQLTATFTPPLDATATWSDLVAGFFPRALAVFVVIAGLLFALDRAPAARAAIAAAARRLAARPGRAVALVAAVAVVASAYPVVFLGKSFVSPNHGTILLYDNYPALPGYSEREVVDVKGTDVGAIMWQHVPYSMMQRRALAQGEAPVWNRYNSAGTPLLGQGQSMFGDPLHLFVIACNGAAWAWDVKYLIAKWLFAVGLGLIVLAVTRGAGEIGSTVGPALAAAPSRDGRDNRDGTPARGGPTTDHDPTEHSGEIAVISRPVLLPALLVALAAPFLGFFAYRLNHPAFFSVCYAPWALYCWVRATQAAGARATTLWAAALIVANLALMNSGTVKEAYMLLLTMNFSGACVLLASATPWRARLTKFAALAAAGVVFAMLTAPIWATFLHALKNSYTGYNAASAFQIQPALLLGAFDEIFYRPLMAEQRMFNPSLNFLLLLGVLYFLATLRTHVAHRAALAIAGSSLVPLALAFGLVPAAWIVRVPFLANIAHVDNTFTCALLVLWSVVGGMGFATALRRLGTPEVRGDLWAAALLLFALVFAWIAFGQAAHRAIFGLNSAFTVILPGQSLPVRPEVWTALAVMLAASAALAWVARRALLRAAFTPALALVGAVAVATLLWRHGMHADAVGFRDYVAHPATRVDFHAPSDAVEFLQGETRRTPARAFGLHGNFFPGWTGVYGLEGIHGPDGLVNPWLRELVDASGVERVWDWRLYVEPATVAAARPFFDAFNVRWYLDLASDQGVLGRSLKFVKAADLDIYESPTAWPRAFFTDRLDIYDAPAEFTAKLKSAAGRPFAAAQRTDLAGQPALAALRRDLDTRTTTTATNFKLTENTTAFDVRASGAGVVVLTEAWWPGDFRAEVNGKKVPLLRVNHAFKGIVVDRAGDYRVVVRCVPKNWPRHLALAGVGAVILFAAVVFALRPARPA